MIMTNETLEQAAEKQWGNVHRTGVLGFIEGAKWQAKRSYSEEDLQEAFYAHNQSWIDYERWFEQFKSTKL